MDFYLNGQLKWTCFNIALNKELNTAGVFVLGQSHQESFFVKQSKKESIKSPVNESMFHMYTDDPNNGFSENIDNSATSYFEEKYSFVGRLFAFNIWNHVKNSDSILNIYHDCRLASCGNATQWSDFRQGTRGEVAMKWPTNLLWKKIVSMRTFSWTVVTNFVTKKSDRCVEKV